MGGNAFGRACSLQQNDASVIFDDVKTLAQRVGFTNITPVGSTFKTAIMNDIDVAANFNGPCIMVALHDAFGKNNVKRCGSTYCVRYHMNDGHAQIDFNIGNVEYISWAMYTCEKSKFKGIIRNIFINSVYTAMSKVTFETYFSSTSRKRYVIDTCRGLYTILQTKLTNDGKELKRWKTLEKTFISDSPKEITMNTLWCDVPATNSLEMLVESISISKAFFAYKEEIANEFIKQLERFNKERCKINEQNLQEAIAKVKKKLNN